MKVRILALAAVVLSVGLLPVAAQGVTRAHPLTTEPDQYTDVDVTISDSRITLSDNDYARADGVNFHVFNKGKRVHSFAIVGVSTGTITPLSADGLKTPLLKPGQKYVIQVYLDVRGVFTFRSLAKADRAKPGMHGRFNVN